MDNNPLEQGITVPLPGAEEPQNEAAPQEPSSHEQPAEGAPQGAEPFEIPQKLVGKTDRELMEIIVNSEKRMHQATSETAEEKKRGEELQERISLLEQRYSQPSPQEQVQQPEVDPFVDYDRGFDENPKDAIKNLMQAQSERAYQETARIRQEDRRSRGQAYLDTLKKDNPLFEDLKPEISTVANKYQDIIKDEYKDSPEVVELAYLAAQGLGREKLDKRVMERANRESKTKREEKLQAFSEGASAETPSISEEQFAQTAPLDQVRKYFGIKDD